MPSLGWDPYCRLADSPSLAWIPCSELEHPQSELDSNTGQDHASLMDPHSVLDHLTLTPSGHSCSDLDSITELDPNTGLDYPTALF